MRRKGSGIIFFFCISTLFSYGQAPDIYYGAYKFFLLDSAISPLHPVNKGGLVPAGRYSQTTTLAGNGAPAYQNGKAGESGFNHPSGIAAGEDGALYISDEKNNSIRKLHKGEVTTIATGFKGPAGLAMDREGSIYVADAYNHRICKISATGKVSIFAGSGKAGDSDHANPLVAQFKFPAGVATDRAGNVYVADEGNHKIRKINPKGEVSTLAGNGRSGDHDDKDGKLAAFNQPVDIATDSLGNIYVADQLNHKIRIISPEGSVSTLAGNGFAGSANHSNPGKASFNNPRAVAVGSAGCIYVGDTGNQLIRRIGPDKAVSTLAGSGASGSADSQEGSLASFFFPAALAETAEGLAVADCLNNKIRNIRTTGFRISPLELPRGLSFDFGSGRISGTPLEIFPGRTYQITAHNAFGSGSTSLTLASSDQPGNALNFDGINDRVFVQNDPLLTPEVVTVEMWVKTGNGLPNHRFILKRNTLPHFDESYSLGIGPQGFFELLMSPDTGLTATQVRITNDEVPIPNKWYFVAGVFTEKDARLYIDGELAAHATSGFPISRSNNGLFLNFDERSKMTLDEVRLFNYDRSPHFKEDMVRPVSPDEPGLFAYYDFNIGIAGKQNAYPTLYDKTRNNFHGELQHFYPVEGTISNWVKSYAMVVPGSVSAKVILPDSFIATWRPPVFGQADLYLLDVASDKYFSKLLPGYNAKKVSGTELKIDGLMPVTQYYFRVRAYNAARDEQGGNSTIIPVLTGL